MTDHLPLNSAITCNVVIEVDDFSMTDWPAFGICIDQLVREGWSLRGYNRVENQKIYAELVRSWELRDPIKAIGSMWGIGEQVAETEQP